MGEILLKDGEALTLPMRGEDFVSANCAPISLKVVDALEKVSISRRFPSDQYKYTIVVPELNVEITDLKSFFRSTRPDGTSKSDDEKNEDKEIGEQFFAHYHDVMLKSFPIPGEVESKEAYLRKYLIPDECAWNALVLRDATTRAVIGGANYQIIKNITGGPITQVHWCEHAFYVPTLESSLECTGNLIRDPRLIKEIFNTLVAKMHSEGSEALYMEYNDPNKMSVEDIALDTAKSMNPYRRCLLWKAYGFMKLMFGSQTAPYTLSSMGVDDRGAALPAVRFLSQGFVFANKSLTTLPIENAMSLYLRTQETLVDLNTDPDVQRILAEYAKIAQKGDEFEILPLVSKEESKLFKEEARK